MATVLQENMKDLSKSLKELQLPLITIQINGPNTGCKNGSIIVTWSLYENIPSWLSVNFSDINIRTHFESSGMKKVSLDELDVNAISCLCSYFGFWIAKPFQNEISLQKELQQRLSPNLNTIVRTGLNDVIIMVVHFCI